MLALCLQPMADCRLLVAERLLPKLLFAENHHTVAYGQPPENRLPVVFFLPARHEVNLLFAVFAGLLQLRFAVNLLYAAALFDWQG